MHITDVMSTQLLMRWVLAAAVALAIPICLMIPGNRPRVPLPNSAREALQEMPNQIPTSLVPFQARNMVAHDTTAIDIEYREPVSAGDQSTARDRIYAEAQEDCAAAAAQFHKTCSVARIAFDENPAGRSSDQSMLLAHAQLRLKSAAP